MTKINNIHRPIDSYRTVIDLGDLQYIDVPCFEQNFFFFLKGKTLPGLNRIWLSVGAHSAAANMYAGDRTQREKQEDNALSNKRRSAIIHVLGRRDHVIVTETTRIYIYILYIQYIFTVEGKYPVCQGLSHTLTCSLMFLIPIKALQQP